MKKLFTLIIFVQLAVSAIAAAWTGSIATGFSGGDGTLATPYLIATGDELAYLAQQANSGSYLAATSAATLKYFKLTADIDLGNVAWTPIGNATNKFGGVFDGDNHTISNISINITTGTLTANAYAGLFGWVTGGANQSYVAVVKNLTMASGSVVATAITGSFSYFVGGIIGRGDNVQISNCKNAATVSGYSYTGGIVGRIGAPSPTTMSIIVENCSNSGTVSGTSNGSFCGGIIGSIAAATSGSLTSYIRYCYNTGAISVGTSGGGIIGSASDRMTIQECFNKGTVTVTNTGAGGIVGRGSGAALATTFNVLNCYNTGAVSQTSTSNANVRAGGILGYSNLTGTYQAITNCYNTGAITGKTGTTSTAIDAIAADKVSPSAITNCYYLTGSGTNTVSAASEVNAATLQGSAATLDGTKWSSDVTPNLNGGYPILSWQTTQLSTPTVNAASSLSSYGFTASWTVTNYNAQSYDVKVYSGSTLVSTTNVAGGLLTANIISLNSNTTYTYKVTAKSAAYPDSNESTASATFTTASPTFWTGTVAGSYAGGAGTLANPYQIATADQLAYLASQANAAGQTTNGNTSGKYYKLIADVDLDSLAWTPIGSTSTTAFAGIFDGDNHIISNIYINATVVNQGLFGYVFGTSSANPSAIVKNITIGSGSITTTQSYAAGVVARCQYAQLSNCKNAIAVTGLSYTGGIVGRADGVSIIENCGNTGALTSTNSSNAYTAGIVASFQALTTNGASDISYVRNCYNRGAVNAASYSGGIIGNGHGYLTIDKCFNTGSINVTTGGSAGIIGYGYTNTNGVLDIKNCYNTGLIKASTSVNAVNCAGGILGYVGSANTRFFGTILNCYNTGTITGYVKEPIAGQLYGATGGGTGTVTNSNFLASSGTNTIANDGTSVAVAATLQGYASTLNNSQDPTVWNTDATSKNNGYPILTWQTATTSALSAPTVGTASSITTTGFTANWTAATNALGYTVNIYQNGTTFVQSSSVTGQATATLAITGLTANTNYTYKVAAISNTGTVDSNESSASAAFTTLGVPTVTNQAVSAIATTTATGNGNITSLGNPNPTQHGHCWNTTATPTTSNTKTSKSAASATGAYTSSMTSLIANTIYYVRSYATNPSGTAYGAEVIFTTLPAAPTVAAASSITTSGFTANWTAPTQGAATFTYTVEYGTVSDLSSGTTLIENIASTNLSSTIGSLAASTTYYYRVKAVNSGSGAWSGIQSLSTGANITTSTLASALSLTAANDVVVSSGGTLTIDQTTEVKSITVAAGGKLTHSSGTLNATNGITLESDATGTATLMDSYTEPTITATVQQYLSSARNWYYTPAVSGVVVPASSTYFGYDEAGLNGDLNPAGASAYWKPYATGASLTAGKGYIVQPGSATTLSFTNTTVSGDVSPVLTYNLGKGNGYNLVGNPYPSYLIWSAVATDPSNTNLTTGANMPTGTIWYRTVNYNGKSAWAANTTYTVDDIVYNGTKFYKATSITNPGLSAPSGNGPIGTGTAPITDNDVTWVYQGSVYVFATVSASGVATPSNVISVNNLIPPMQAFWVKTTTGGGTLHFKNTMRSHNTTGGANALKAPKSSASEMPLVRLSVTNGAGVDEAVVFASENATNAFDPFDAPKYFNTNSNQAEIYSQIGNEKLVINAMNEITAGTEIALGFVTEKSNNFKIAATELKNLNSNLQVILKDKQLNREFDLSAGSSYEFSSEVVNSADRFSIIFRTTGNATGIDNAEKGNTQVFVNAANQITIIAPEKSNYTIYNAVGQKVTEGITTANCTIANGINNSGIYVVKVSENGKNYSTRVILNGK